MSRTETLGAAGHLPKAVGKEEQKEEKGSLLDGIDPVDALAYSRGSSTDCPVDPADTAASIVPDAGVAEGAAQEAASSLLDTAGEVAGNIVGSILDGI